MAYSAHPDQSVLAEELEKVRARTLKSLFDRPPLQLLTLYRIAEELNRSQWEDPLRRVDILEAALRAAIGKLPTTPLPKSTSNPPVSVRDAALMLFGLYPFTDRQLGEINEYTAPRQDYAKVAQYVRDLSRFPGGEKEFRPIASRIRHEMAKHLLMAERKTPHPSPPLSERGETSTAEPDTEDVDSKKVEATTSPSERMQVMSITATVPDAIAQGVMNGQINNNFYGKLPELKTESSD
ncbi:hypothetical protein [Nocardia fluminea]|uniref:hypothetical protein n=1 Tax=Nocardia fluminea TaxID=134984 RepID=UPI003D15126B